MTGRSTTEDTGLAPAAAAPADAAARAQHRSRTARLRSRRRLPRRRVVGLSVAGLAVAGWIAYASPLTLVEHVVVTAPRGLSEDALRLASGIAATDHVPAVDADRVREALKTSSPAVAHVEVQRSLPNTIRLVVTARTPLAAVAAGKGYYLMDSEGVLYDKVGSAKGVPVVKASTDRGRDTARAVLLSLPEDLRATVKAVSASTRDDVSLVLRSGAKVTWGSAGDAELKAKVLDGLVALKADAYDVSAPLLPTTTGGEVGAEQ